MADWMDAVWTADVAMDSRRAVEQLKAQSKKEVNACAEDACSLHIPRSDLGEQFMEGKADADGAGWTSGRSMRVEANEDAACSAGADATRLSGTRCSDAASKARTLCSCNMVTASQCCSLSAASTTETEAAAVGKNDAGHDARRTMTGRVASSDGLCQTEELATKTVKPIEKVCRYEDNGTRSEEKTGMRLQMATKTGAITPKFLSSPGSTRNPQPSDAAVKETAYLSIFI